MSQAAIPGQDDLQDAVNRESHEYVKNNAAPYFTAIARAIAKGATPEQVRDFLRSTLPSHRGPLVERCYQAACWEAHLQVNDVLAPAETSNTFSARVPRRS